MFQPRLRGASIYTVLMPLAVAVVADDLTGAADTGAGLLAKGFAPLVTWDASLAAATDGAVAIDMQTRVMTEDAARGATSRTVAALRATSVPVLYKKCDSLLRGHVGAEASAARAAWGSSAVAIVAPAFPDLGRTTVAGRQHADGAAIGAPPIAEIFEREGLRARLVDLADIRGNALSERFAQLHASGVVAIVCDAETNRDLEAIAAAGQRLESHAVWVGTGGLIRALPLQPAAAIDRRRPSISVDDLPILAVVGSRAAASRAQADALAGGAMTPLPLSLSDADIGAAAVAAASDRLVTLLRERTDVLLTLDGPSDAPESRRVAERLGALLEPHAALVAALVVTGGDTATAILRRWGTTALRLLDEVEPGVPLLVSTAPKSIPVVTKAGAFGGRDALVRAVDRLRGLRKQGRR